METGDGHARRSIRLHGYDYSQAGVYFVTLCTKGRKTLFGDIVDGKMRLNGRGEIIRDEWVRTAIVRANVEMDYFVVMPNHVHGILVVLNVGATRRVAPTIRQKDGPPRGFLGAIIGQFKSVTCKKIKKIEPVLHPPFWQRNYYEHVIRNENEMNLIRKYIELNPAKWTLDRENPEALPRSPGQKEEIEKVLGARP
jgi:putative transposase